MIARCPISWNISVQRYPNFINGNIKSHGETSFRQELRLTVRFILFPVIQGMSNGGKALHAGDDHIVGSTGTVDDQQIAAFVPATHYADMSIFWIEYQIAGLGLLPGDRGTVGMLHTSTTAMADNIFAVADIIESPVHKAGTVQPIGSIGAGCGVAIRPHLGELPPAGVPAENQ